MKQMNFEEACEHRNAHFVLGRFGLYTKEGDLDREAINKLAEEQRKLYALGISLWDESIESGGEVVATLNQLSIPVGKIAKSNNPGDKVFRLDRVERPLFIDAKVELTQFLTINSSYKSNGRHYEIDMEKTAAYKDALAKDIKRRKDASEMEETAGKAFTSGVAALANGAKAANKKTVPVKQPERLYVVDIDNNLQEYGGFKEDFVEADYLCSGTKAECEAFLNPPPAKKVKKAKA